MKRFLSVILTLVVVLSFSSVSAYAADGDTIYISNQDEYYDFLKKVWNGNTFKGKTVVLTADITTKDIFCEPDFRDITINDYVTSGNTNYFAGTFDGDGHSIKNIPMYAYGVAGLFCAIGNATVKNLTFEDISTVSFRDSDDVTAEGTVAAFAFGTNYIKNVKVINNKDEIIDVGKDCGGLIGIVEKNSSLWIDSCEVAQKIRGCGPNIGGFVGHIRESATVTINNSTMSSNILQGFSTDRVINASTNRPIFSDELYVRQNIIFLDTTYNMGGFVGIADNDVKLTINNCSNNGSIAVEEFFDTYGTWNDSFTYGNNGGFVGVCYGDVIINDSINNGEVLAHHRNAGGLIGIVDGRGTAEIYNSTNTANVTAQESAGGIIGYFGNRDADNSIIIKNCTNEGTIKSDTGYAAGIAALIDSDASETSPHILTGNKNTGFINGNTYAGGIVAVNYGYAEFTDCENSGKISGEKEMAAGILAWSEDDDVSFENCHNLKEAIIGSDNEAGGIIAYFGNRNRSPKFVAKNCSNDGFIFSTNGRAGGIAAQLDSNGRLYFINVDNNGGVYGGWNAGGICGESEGYASFTGAANNGIIISTNNGAGGILAWNSDDELIFIGCKNTGDITGEEEAGGILGITGSDNGDRDMYFEDCTNSGRIESKSYQAAGIAGKVDTDGTHTFKDVSNSGTIIGGWSAGGICADIMGTTNFTNATNSGSVTAKTKSVGGILAWSENQPIIFTNCSNSGSIYGKEYAGGIGGVMYDEAADPAITAESCKNSGAVTSQTTDAGGIIGALCTDGDCKFTNCKNESGGNIKGARQVGGIFGWTCGNYTLLKNCSNSGRISTTGSKNDGFHAGTLYGSYENSVTCEGCTNYAASIFTGYSAWILSGCAALLVVSVIAIVIYKKNIKT